jgi:hypothetical protein
MCNNFWVGFGDGHCDAHASGDILRPLVGLVDSVKLRLRDADSLALGFGNLLPVVLDVSDCHAHGVGVAHNDSDDDDFGFGDRDGDAVRFGDDLSIGLEYGDGRADADGICVGDSDGYVNSYAHDDGVGVIVGNGDGERVIERDDERVCVVDCDGVRRSKCVCDGKQPGDAVIIRVGLRDCDGVHVWFSVRDKLADGVGVGVAFAVSLGLHVGIRTRGADDDRVRLNVPERGRDAVRIGFVIVVAQRGRDAVRLGLRVLNGEADDVGRLDALGDGDAQRDRITLQFGRRLCIGAVNVVVSRNTHSVSHANADAVAYGNTLDRRIA